MLVHENLNHHSINNNGNGVGTDMWINVLKEQYKKLAATYQKKGMLVEAKLFLDIVQEFTDLQTKSHKEKECPKKLNP